MIVTQEYLKSILHYNPDSGKSLHGLLTVGSEARKGNVQAV
jgi:hypothetical protein